MLKRNLLLCMISLVVILAMMNYTSPTEVGPLGVLVFFTTFYLLMTSIASGIINVFRVMSQKKENTEKRDFFYAVIIGFGPIILLLMQAMGALSLWTGALAVLFVFLGCFLIKNRFSVVK